MMLLRMKTLLALLWGISISFSTESVRASTPETSSINSTAEPNKTTEQLISRHVVHSETQTQHATRQPTHKPAEVSIAATAAETSVLSTVETEEAIVTNSSDSPNDSTVGLVAMSTVATATISSSEAQPPHRTTTSETAKATEDQSHQQSPTTSTDMTPPATTSATTPATTPATTSAASTATPTTSLPQPTSTTKPEVTAESFSTTSPADSTQAPVFIQNLSSPSASTTTTANPTSEAAPVFDPTTSETSTTSTSSFSTDSAVTTTAAVTTGPAGILIPRVPKRLPIPTTKSTRATTRAPPEAPSTEVQPCSTRGVVTKCLIVIASLAGLATIFMVSTIVLCTKLSVRKYKVKKPQQATEMMCISALLPEKNYTYTRQRNPVTNGVLVIHSGGDSDEDGGDNLTLSSFLPENDRFV